MGTVIRKPYLQCLLKFTAFIASSPVTMHSFHKSVELLGTLCGCSACMWNLTSRGKLV